MSYLWLCLLGVIIQVVFILTEYRKKYVPAVILKGLASLVFIAFGILSMSISSNKGFAGWIVAGLVLGGIGDVCLNLRFVFEKIAKKIMTAGVAAFLVGHILYLCALMPLNSTLLIYSIPVGVLTAALLLWWLLSNIEVKGAFKIFGIIYIGSVIVMPSVATSLWISNPQNRAYFIYMIGAILFTASDVILVFNMFGRNKKKWYRATNLSLYYFGQLLIALSMQII